MLRLVSGMVSLSFFLVGCAPDPIARDELATAVAAPKPSSEEAAHTAAVAFFRHSLFDPEAARWEFMPLKNSVVAVSFMTRGDFDENGYIRNHGNRAGGWFLCGFINGKNRLGGYTGDQTFFAFFLPSVRNVVAEGSIGDAATRVCHAIYCVTPFIAHQREASNERTDQLRRVARV